MIDGWPVVNGREEPETLAEAVQMTVGAGSMCWVGGPHGVFDSERAIQASERLQDWINKHYMPVPESVTA